MIYSHCKKNKKQIQNIGEMKAVNDIYVTDLKWAIMGKF